jgi:hypothetical protein
MPTVYDGLFPDGTLLTAATRPRGADISPSDSAKPGGKSKR